MADYLPWFNQGDQFTSQASGTITAGQVVAVSGDGTVAAAGANAANTVGVAAFDAVSGDKVTIFRGGVQYVTNTGGVTAGDNISSAASGAVATTTSTNPVIGVALTTATTGNKVQVLFNR